jgi:hypothetical protein
MTDRELLQDALDALNNFDKGNHGMRWQVPLIKALRARLAQPEPAQCDGGQCGIGGYCKQCPKTQLEQEPVAYLCENAVGHKYFRWKKPSSEYKPIALYTAHASPQRIWQGLTDEEVVVRANAEVFAEAFARGAAWAELKLKEKNNG